jgi:hypothetical protein
MFLLDPDIVTPSAQYVRMPILSYGEDALTLHALRCGLPDLLNALSDPTPTENAIVFFRPSFGRRSTRPSGRRRSEFGEPDAIIGTPSGTYVVEAKWSSSGEKKQDSIDLRTVQVRRHEVLEAYLTTWRRLPQQSWPALTRAVGPLLDKINPPVAVPSQGTRLAQNLEFVLRELQSCGPVKRVLLFSRCSHEAEPGALDCDGFHVVKYACSTVRGSHFVDLDELPPKPVTV